MIFDARQVLITEWDSDSTHDEYLVRHGTKLTLMEIHRRLVARYGELRTSGKFGPSAGSVVWPSWWFAL